MKMKDMGALCGGFSSFFSPLYIRRKGLRPSEVFFFPLPSPPFPYPFPFLHKKKNRRGRRRFIFFCQRDFPPPPPSFPLGGREEISCPHPSLIPSHPSPPPVRERTQPPLFGREGGGREGRPSRILSISSSLFSI